MKILKNTLKIKDRKNKTKSKNCYSLLEFES